MTEVDTASFDKSNSIPFNVLKNKVETESLKQTDVMLIHYYQHFCDNACINPLDIQDSFKKMIVVCIRSTDRCHLHSSVKWANSHLHWEWVQTQNKNMVADTKRWVDLLEFTTLDCALEFVIVEKRKDLNIIHAYSGALNACGLSLSILDIYRLIILNNMMDITSVLITEIFLNRKLRVDCHSISLQLSGIMADFRFSAEDYCSSIAHILNSLTVAEELADHLSFSIKHRSNVKEMMKNKHLQATTGRLRLRDRQRSIKSESVVLNETNIDTFDGWSVRVRFPNILSKGMKLKCYLTCACQHLKTLGNLQQLCKNKELSQNVFDQVINNPDPDILVSAIEEVKIYQNIFPELYQFSRQCFANLATRQRRDLTPPLMLHLYLASYQDPKVWKAVWKGVYPVLSYAIIRDVEKFVKDNSMNSKVVFSLILNS